MKQSETAFGMPRRYLVVMLLCFLYAGFALFLFASLGYSAFWRSEIARPFRIQIQGGPLFDNNRDYNRFPPDVNQDRLFIGGLAERRPNDPLTELLAPNALVLLFGGLISILAGLSIWQITRVRELKKLKQETTDNLLLPDEKTIIHFLKENGFESTQSRLVKETGLSKVQVHRILSRLEAKGVLEKHKYGLTNKIVLKKELFE